MNSNNKLKEIDIKIHRRYYFNDIIKIKDSKNVYKIL